MATESLPVPQPPATTATIGVPGTSTTTLVVPMTDWSVLVPIIVTGLGVVIGQITNALISVRNGKKSDAIHVLVNSGMTKALADNAAQAEEIRILRTLVQSLNERVAALPAPTETARPTAREIERAQAVLDSARLPSDAVVAAQASTPDKKP